MRVLQLALLVTLACGPPAPAGFGQDWAMVIGTTPLLPAGCCLQVLAGQHDWALQNTSAVPIDCDAQAGQMAIITYRVGSSRHPTAVEYIR